MKANLNTVVRPVVAADLPAEDVHLSSEKLRILESAIPFRHSPTEQERTQPVVTDIAAVPPSKRKWHHDHDALIEDYDTDVVLNELPKESLAPLGSRL